MENLAEDHTVLSLRFKGIGKLRLVKACLPISPQSRRIRTGKQIAQDSLMVNLDLPYETTVYLQL